MARTPWLTLLPAHWVHRAGFQRRRLYSRGRLGWAWWLILGLAVYTITAASLPGDVHMNARPKQNLWRESAVETTGPIKTNSRRTLIEMHQVHNKQANIADNSEVFDYLMLDFTQDSNYNLSRAPAAVHLEKVANMNPVVGICQNQASLLQEVPHDVCQELHCLWVEHLHLNIDVDRYPLTVLPRSSQHRCSLPKGGQRPVPDGYQPYVSFVITMHNNAAVTSQCLLELFRTSSEVQSAEYIILDDGSTDDALLLTETIWRLRELFKVQLVMKRNTDALGFGAANAEGIELSTGKYVAMVNNDMYVAKGWLSAIMLTFAMNPNAGIVGPMFMGNGDIITEAGGLVFSDGNAANFARGSEPHHDVCYMRNTDYISAACVVIPRAVIDRVGGFDPQYFMGYYEDTDLAMTIRASGMDVILQPLAVTYHQEGTTFGTDSNSDLKRHLMAENKEFHCPSGTDSFVAANREAYQHLLWVDDIVPEPDRDSGSIRTMNVLKILLGAGYHVTFIPTAGGRDLHYSVQLRHMGVQVMPNIPPERWMLQHNGNCKYDVIIISRRLVYEAAQGQILQHCAGVPIVYDTVDLHFLRESRDAIAALDTRQGPSWDFDAVTTSNVLQWLEQPSLDSQQARLTRDSELYFIDKSQLTIVVSPKEVELIHHYRPNASVVVISNIHDVGILPETKCEGRVGTIFVGNMNHIPNRIAVESLINEVLPWVLKMLPPHILGNFRMNIVGSNVVPDYLMRLFAANKRYVAFHGQISDTELNDLYSQVKVAVAPLLSGAGVKGKVNQAMKMGVPVVSTPIAVEGMYGQDGIDCLIGANPKEFASKVVQLHTHCDLWRNLADGGRRNLRDHFSLSKARSQILQALSSFANGPVPDAFQKKCHQQSNIVKTYLPIFSNVTS